MCSLYSHKHASLQAVCVLNKNGTLLALNTVWHNSYSRMLLCLLLPQSLLHEQLTWTEATNSPLASIRAALKLTGTATSCHDSIHARRKGASCHLSEKYGQSWHQHVPLGAFLASASPLKKKQQPRIVEWFGLEGNLRITLLQPLYHRQRQFPLDQLTQKSNCFVQQVFKIAFGSLAQ